MNGSFIISLDFELHWGGFEKWPLDQYKKYFDNTRAVIPEMLALFQQHDVHVTWATVGMLFHSTRQELEKTFPDKKPAYKVESLSAYHYIEKNGIGEDEQSDPYHFAHSLVKKIIATPHQELATHTFAHYYCNEDGQTLEQFRDDLKAAQRSAALHGQRLTSLVFPRNQFNDEYLQVCFQEGITAVRSNPLDWFWNIQSTQHESVWKRLNRGADAYFPVGHKNTFKSEAVVARDGFPLCIPASRLLRPYRKKEFFLNDFKIHRIKSEMSRAARNNEVYHLWWHPHNFGNAPAESMRDLKKILEHFAFCRQTWAMQSLTMRELTSIIRDGKKT
jgi:peptidoglycan/xylan/chitin deacetylase (PgdA/CDA1 family)